MKPPCKEEEPSLVHFLKIPQTIVDLFALYLIILYFLITPRGGQFDFQQETTEKKHSSRLIRAENISC